MEIDIANITRNDLRVVIHGAVQMMYADGEVSYHEKNAVNKIMKAANLSSAEVVRLKEDIKRLNPKALIPSLSSIDARRLYFLMIEYMFFSDDDFAKRSKNHYVNFRWLGGTLTNSVTIRQSIKKLEEIDRLAQDGYVNMLKKEISKKEKEKKKLDALLGGIRYMFRDPAAVFIIDVHKEKIALNEVKKKKIPVVALVDTNVNPELVDYPVPGNDDSPKTIDLFCQVISAAAIEGRADTEKFR